MASVLKSFAIEGIEGLPVEIEATSIKGQPAFSIIGLGDQAVLEATDRIRAAIIHCGYYFPASKIILNLVPGDLKKRGSHYDFGMAIAILKQSGQLYACGNHEPLPLRLLPRCKMPLFRLRNQKIPQPHIRTHLGTHRHAKTFTVTLR